MLCSKYCKDSSIFPARVLISVIEVLSLTAVLEASPNNVKTTPSYEQSTEIVTTPRINENKTTKSYRQSTEIVTTPRINENKTKCYPFVGCFDNFPPFDNAQLDLPKSPQEVGTQMQIFTNSNPNHGYFLNFTDLGTITKSPFKAGLKIKFIIHGFSNTIKTPWIYEMKDELLKLENMNIVVVTWGPGAAFPNYDQATYILLDTVLELIRLVFTGWLLHGRLARITGMDAAEPDFEHHPIQIRLDETDAQFVDVIHTNGAPFSKGGAGLMQVSGHVDFYVNGGELQPGCPNQFSGAFSGLFGGGFKGAAEAVSCSHSRSHQVFTESINTPCPFTAYPCNTSESFNAGNCLTCGSTGCSQLGYYADMYRARGKLFLNTKAKPPFCGFHYMIKLESGSKTTYGTINIQIKGNFGTTRWLEYIKDDEITQYKTYSKLIISSVEVGEIENVQIKYVKRGKSLFHMFGGESRYDAISLEVTSGEIGGNYFFCLNGLDIPHGTPVTAKKSTTRTCV
ncbi:pancreatic lipase-related protein 2 [Mytilus galloprovincialis]|uniref:Pancreatic lipase-related protein 2 n=1 Tax=Mytilus galloprovincialis TaxID=29158 RepID=A0A8B6CBG7_MYTGA|nr:pancreatic lipase-related protein 2 [Mytilus galloprovincialis]